MQKIGLLVLKIVLTTAVLLTMSTLASAQLHRGVGIFGGVSDHTSEPTSAQFSGSKYDSDGFSLGADFQLPLGGFISVNPFLMFAIEDSPQLVANATVTNGILGVQVRVWPLAGLYAGAHVGSYSQSISVSSTSGNTTTTQSTSGQGFGYGVVVGYEAELNEKFIFIVGYQRDSATDLDVFSDTSIDLTGSRIHFGIRIILEN